MRKQAPEKQLTIDAFSLQQYFVTFAGFHPNAGALQGSMLTDRKICIA